MVKLLVMASQLAVPLLQVTAVVYSRLAEGPELPFPSAFPPAFTTIPPHLTLLFSIDGCSQSRAGGTWPLQFASCKSRTSSFEPLARRSTILPFRRLFYIFLVNPNFLINFN